MRYVGALRTLLRNLRYHRMGNCNICGRPTLFFCTDPATARNNMYCLFCRSSSRNRHVAKIILAEVIKSVSSIAQIPKATELKVLNTDIDDAFSEILRHHSSVVCSALLPDVQPGTKLRERMFCQDLENLTFEDESFDLVITQDVLEHVRDSQKAFQEILRVLKVGGYHVFTVPFYFERQTVRYVDTSGDEDTYLVPPVYHGDTIRGKVLAYRTFGLDLFDFLNSLGFDTRVSFSKYTDEKYGIVDSYVFICRKLDKHSQQACDA